MIEHAHFLPPKNFDSKSSYEALMRDPNHTYVTMTVMTFIHELVAVKIGRRLIRLTKR
jgi:hypothetical protein